MIVGLFLVLLIVFAGSALAAETGDVQTGQQECTFEAQITKTVSLKYLLFLPEGYDGEKKWPLIMFLHGAGERGDDLNQVKVHGIPKIVEQKEDFPFIAVSPQCPRDSWWTSEDDALKALLDEIVGKYAVDPDRVYLTGLSMGGFGTWGSIVAKPGLFAAVAPICGGGDPMMLEAVKDMPIWVFHGAKDEVVPIIRSEELVNKLKELGSRVKFTVYPEAGHDSWTETYSNPKLYEWFLSHQKK